MSLTATPAPILDCSSPTDSFLDEVLAGLRRSQKSIPSKFFYDADGSRLFDQITEVEAYYPTRTEMGIMRANIAEMAATIGSGAILVEYGSGSSLKTRLLLDELPDLVGYVPIDISQKHLIQSAEALQDSYPWLDIRPVCADYTAEFTLPTFERQATNTIVYFPGSTIGNFDSAGALAFLKRVARLEGDHGGLLIGVDLKKDVHVLNRAYNDPQGVTAAFNKNVLARINRELNANFDLHQFQHYAFYNPVAGRIEMHLQSLTQQTVTIAGEAIRFEAFETILTEYSHKYSLDDFAALAGQAGFSVASVWTDSQRWFSVQYLTLDTKHG